MLKQKQIILASGSPRRQKILKKTGLKFKIVKSRLEEDKIVKKFKKLSTKKLVKLLAFLKALSALTNSNTTLSGKETIIGFDTIVVCKNKIVNKPKNKTDALRKILYLSNRQHKVLTGIALIDLKKKRILVDCETTKVFMKNISKKEAISYIKTKEPMDKAGAYAIQGKGKKFIKKISGDYFNVVGLPLKKLIHMLKI